jgi:hypothetical protein
MGQRTQLFSSSYILKDYPNRNSHYYIPSYNALETVYIELIVPNLPTGQHVHLATFLEVIRT